MTEGTFAFNRSQPVVLALVAAFAAFSILLIPMHKAEAAETTLMDRVNEAIREAGVPTTVARSNAFQIGVHIGSYTTYNQLVGAILYHKAKETLPEFSKKNPTVATQCITGEIVSLSDSNVAIKSDGVKSDGHRGISTRTIKLATNQYDLAIERGAKADSNVTLCSTDNFFSQYGHLTVN